MKAEKTEAKAAATKVLVWNWVVSTYVQKDIPGRGTNIPEF